MTTTKSIITSAQFTLQDDGTRWSIPELIGYINEGQREIASLRPDEFTVTAALALVRGPKQTLPTACSKFVDITRNTSGQSVRQTDKSMLDAVEPNWYAKAPSKVIKHFCYDLREPHTFFVYPPALGPVPPALGASLDVTYSTLPADVTETYSSTTVRTLATLTGDVNVSPLFNNALLNFVLFRAYAKDAEGTSNAALSASYYQLFKAGVVEEASPRQAVQPTPTN